MYLSLESVTIEVADDWEAAHRGRDGARRIKLEVAVDIKVPSRSSEYANFVAGCWSKVAATGSPLKLMFAPDCVSDTPLLFVSIRSGTPSLLPSTRNRQGPAEPVPMLP